MYVGTCQMPFCGKGHPGHEMLCRVKCMHAGYVTTGRGGIMNVAGNETWVSIVEVVHQ